MTGPLRLEALDGTNPLGFLAALGALHCADAQVATGGHRPALGWTDELAPRALITGVTSQDDLLDRLEAERDAVARCTALNWPPEAPLPTAKPLPDTLRAWARACYEDPDPRSAAVFNALVAEGAYAQSTGTAKPTHLDFTAGQQQLLDMVRTLADLSTRTRLTEALTGWVPFTKNPSLAWDATDERLYALRAVNPSGDTKSAVPAANWLAFLGLMALPVVNRAGTLATTGCDRGWKMSSLTWFLWPQPLTKPAAWAVLRGAAPYVPGSVPLRSAIRRTAQGGYGSFAGPSRRSGTPPLNPLLHTP